jgi:hypothetical protein
VREPHPRIRTALVSLDPGSKRPAWHGAPTILGLLRGVRPATAVWVPPTGVDRPHSIRDIALHVAFWENSVANRLSGESARVPFEQTPWPGWPAVVDPLTEKQWKGEVRYVTETHRRLVSIVEGFDPRRLDEPPSPRTSRRAIEFIHGVAEHNLYHAGHLKMVKRLAHEAGVA